MMLVRQTFRVVSVQYRFLRFGARTVEENESRHKETKTESDQNSKFVKQDIVSLSGDVSKIGIDPYSQHDKLQMSPEKLENSKLLRIAILGKPNVGKSHLTNALTGFNVQAVSNKIHTTRYNARAVCTVNENTQLVFVDTPGLMSLRQAKKSKINKEMVYDPELALKHVDLILVLHDASNPYAYKIIDSRILHLLYRHRHLPAILVLNKTDAMKIKSRILEIVHCLTKSRVDNKILMRQTSRLYEILSKDKKIGDILAAYKTKRIAETSLQKSEDHQESKLEVADMSNSQNNENAGQQPPTKETEDPDFDKTLWNVDWDTIAKIENKPMHEVPLNQLRKCYMHERGWPYFKAVFTTSALQGTGVDKLKDYLVKMAKPNAWKYHSTIVSPMNSVTLAKETVRSKVLDNVEGYVAYNLEYRIVVWEVNEHDALCIFMHILCRRPGHIPVVLGPDGKTIQVITAGARQELSNLFGRDVHIKLSVTSGKKSALTKK